MKTADLRSQGLDALQKQEADLRKELFNFRCQAVLGNLGNSARVSMVRRDIARVLTVIKEKSGK